MVFVGAADAVAVGDSFLGVDETVSASQHPKIDLITHPPVDADWLEGELERLERLVTDGETLELVGSLNRLLGGSRGAASTVPRSEPVG